MAWLLRQSTASQEIPLGPFVDSTDGNTAETGLTIANTDIKLQKTGATTQANKNSGGATHIATGDYFAVLDATDSDTLGAMRVKVHVAGALPVWLDCCVLPANVYDAIVLGTDKLDVSAVEFAGQTITAGAGVTMPATVASSTNITAGTITTVTNLTNAPTNGDLTATMKTSVTTAATAATPTAAAVTGAVGSVTGAVGSVTGNVGGNVAGSVGSVTGLTASDVGAIKTKTDALPTDPADQSLIIAATNAITAAIAALNNLDAAGVRTAVGLASANLDTQLDALPTNAEMEARTLLAASYATAVGVSAVETDTQDIQARLPAALTANGNMKADTLRINGNTVTGGGATAWNRVP